MSQPFKNRTDLAAKIEWEGGVFAAMEYGITVADMPEADTELIEAWTKLDAAFKVAQGAADAVAELLPDES